ncbi:MAG: tetratricopeptide repeat protein, partial [Phycisphaerales bacterium]
IDTVSMLHERLGQFSKAAEMLDYLLVIDPSNAKAMARLAILYSDQLGQPERGIMFAERARSLSPRMPEVLDALGWSYYQAGRKEKAKEYLQRSLKLGETMNAYVHLSQLLTDEGQLEKALDNLRIAQELAEDTYSVNSIKALQDDIRSTQNN